MRMQINYSMCWYCLLSTRALSRARSADDALFNAVQQLRSQNIDK